MYGTNEVTKPNELRQLPKGQLLVNDIFYTIQGEGPDAGKPAVFIRLAKCNLRCFFCDTEFERGRLLTIDNILDRLSGPVGLKPPLVVITGGEPMLQNIIPLVIKLNDYDWHVAIETAGTVVPPGLCLVDWRGLFNKIVCSPKTPLINRDVAEVTSAFKYVIRAGDVDPEDGLPMMSTQTEGQTARLFRSYELYPGTPIYVSPMDEGAKEKNIANTEEAVSSALKFGYRLSIQLHKLEGVMLP